MTHNKNAAIFLQRNRAMVALLELLFVLPGNHYVVCGIMFSHSVFLLGSEVKLASQAHQGQVLKEGIGCVLIQDFIIDHRSDFCFRL